ncbi:adenosylcobinamide-phosphate synthase CbiB [Salipiger sp.]|uniref:adenosylcobinamide-phosphate synthase CbiB n=1 Tax=Salipiger sp. TaxID=2078585 RepID=UPI003A9762D1
MSVALMMLTGLGLDLLLGWPGWLYARISHPVVWLGRLVGALEARLNRGPRARRLWTGALTTVTAVLLAALPMWALQSLLPQTLAGSLIAGVLAWPLIAMRSMHDHVAAVARPLAGGDLPGARRSVSAIVGRDPSRLDEAGVARAAIESLAENTSDGIVAPLVWGLIGGLPGIAAYKAVNTLDSMIGHRDERYEAFGKVAARLDDVANLLPARLTGLLFALAGGRRAAEALRVMLRDAPKHRSPNAGWPEGAMAAALGVRLSGPRTYGDRIAEEPWLNGAAPDPGPRDLSAALALYRCAMVLCALALGVAALL